MPNVLFVASLSIGTAVFYLCSNSSILGFTLPM